MGECKGRPPAAYMLVYKFVLAKNCTAALISIKIVQWYQCRIEVILTAVSDMIPHNIQKYSTHHMKVVIAGGQRRSGKPHY